MLNKSVNLFSLANSIPKPNPLLQLSGDPNAHNIYLQTVQQLCTALVKRDKVLLNTLQLEPHLTLAES